MRCFVDVLAMYARTALRAAISSAERIEAANQQLSANWADILGRLEKLEKIISGQSKNFDAPYGQRLIEQATTIATRNALEAIKNEMVLILKTAPTGGPQIQTAEADLVKKAVGEIGVLSKEFRRLVVNALSEMRSLAKQITSITSQEASRSDRPSLPSKWERYWAILAGMAICLVIIGLAYWAGLRAGGN